MLISIIVPANARLFYSLWVSNLIPALSLTGKEIIKIEYCEEPLFHVVRQFLRLVVNLLNEVDRLLQSVKYHSAILAFSSGRKG